MRHNNNSSDDNDIAPQRVPKTVAGSRPLVVVVISLVLFVLFATTSHAYPVLVQVEETSDRCFRFNIPEDDDAHLIAIVLPSEDEMGPDDLLEQWFVEQVFAMTKAKEAHKLLPKTLPNDPPDAVAQRISEYQQKHGGRDAAIRLKITGTPTSDPHNFHHVYATKYFTPVVVNYVGRTTDARSRRHRTHDHVNLEGYGICVSNTDNRQHLQVIFDIVLVSEEILDDDQTESQKQRFEKQAHLTPLEQSLDASIAAAQTVLREMSYMEKREGRMRQTAESINARVRGFSYLSVSVLLSVTYLQVTYLKRYFHKKKLM